MTPEQIERHCTVTPEAEQLVKKAFQALNLSMRGYHKLLKIARTIADLESMQDIDVTHVREALMYRSLDQTLEKQRS